MARTYRMAGIPVSGDLHHESGICVCGVPMTKFLKHSDVYSGAFVDSNYLMHTRPKGSKNGVDNIYYSGTKKLTPKGVELYIKRGWLADPNKNKADNKTNDRGATVSNPTSNMSLQERAKAGLNTGKAQLAKWQNSRTNSQANLNAAKRELDAATAANNRSLDAVFGSEAQGLRGRADKNIFYRPRDDISSDAQRREQLDERASDNWGKTSERLTNAERNYRIAQLAQQGAANGRANAEAAAQAAARDAYARDQKVNGRANAEAAAQAAARDAYARDQKVNGRANAEAAAQDAARDAYARDQKVNGRANAEDQAIYAARRDQKVNGRANAEAQAVDAARAADNRNFFQRAGDWLGGAVNTVGDAFGDAARWVGDRANDVGNWWRHDITGESQWNMPSSMPPEAQQQYYNSMRNGGDTSLFGRIGQAARGVGSAINDAAGWVGNAAGDVAGWVGDRANDVGNFWRNNITGEGQWDAYNRMAGNGAPGWAQQAEYERLRNGGDTSLFGRIGQAGRDAAGWVGNAAGDVAGWVGGAANDVGNFWRNNITGEGQWDEYNRMVAAGAPQEALDRYYNNLRNGGDTSAFGRIGQAARGVGSAANDVAGWVGNAANTVGRGASDFWRNNITGEGQWDEYNRMVAAGAPQEALDRYYNNLRNGGDTSAFGRIGQAARGVGSAVNDATGWVGDRVNDAAEWVGDRANDAGQVSARTWDYITGGPQIRDQMRYDVSGDAQRNEQPRIPAMPSYDNIGKVTSWASQNGRFYNPRTGEMSNSPEYVTTPNGISTYYIVDENGQIQSFTRSDNSGRLTR